MLHLHFLGILLVPLVGIRRVKVLQWIMLPAVLSCSYTQISPAGNKDWESGRKALPHPTPVSEVPDRERETILTPYCCCPQLSAAPVQPSWERQKWLWSFLHLRDSGESSSSRQDKGKWGCGEMWDVPLITKWKGERIFSHFTDFRKFLESPMVHSSAKEGCSCITEPLWTSLLPPILTYGSTIHIIFDSTTFSNQQDGKDILTCLM